MRMCAICNTKKDKRELLRIVCDKEKNISIDKTGKLQGRGAYICYNLDCLKKAMKSKKLDRTFETSIDKKVYSDINSIIVEKEN